LVLSGRVMSHRPGAGRRLRRRGGGSNLWRRRLVRCQRRRWMCRHRIPGPRLVAYPRERAVHSKSSVTAATVRRR